MPLNGFGYASLKALGAELRRPPHSLIVLSDDNDPWLSARPGRRRDGARWFADLWARLEIPDGVHLRRLHYLLVSTANITLPDGTPYLNTHRCWKLLGSASSDARYLDFVDAGAFVDRRAPEPITYFPDEAAEIDALVAKSVRERLALSEPMDDRVLIERQVARVEVQREQLLVELAGADAVLREGAMQIPGRSR